MCRYPLAPTIAMELAPQYLNAWEVACLRNTALYVVEMAWLFGPQARFPDDDDDRGLQRRRFYYALLSALAERYDLPPPHVPYEFGCADGWSRTDARFEACLLERDDDVRVEEGEEDEMALGPRFLTAEEVAALVA